MSPFLTHSYSSSSGSAHGHVTSALLTVAELSEGVLLFMEFDVLCLMQEMHRLSKSKEPMAHYALESRSLPMIKAIVDSGINLTEKNEQGLSVLYCACRVSDSLLAFSSKLAFFPYDSHHLC